MLSYQHIYHAGGPADVYKHSILIHVLTQLKAKNRAVHYMETHAGRGLYDISSKHAKKTGEAKQGIARLMAETDCGAWSKPLLTQVHLLQKKFKGQYYPGSPMVAQSILTGKGDLFSLMELHPREEEALRKYLGADDRVYIEKLDGYAGVIGILRHEEADDTCQNVILIDPSFEIKTEYQSLCVQVEKMLQADKTAVIAIWYPLLPAGLHQAMLEQLAGKFTNIWMKESLFAEQGTVRGMNGSGMVLINMPQIQHDALNKIAQSCQNFFLK